MRDLILAELHEVGEEGLRMNPAPAPVVVNGFAGIVPKGDWYRSRAYLVWHQKGAPALILVPK